MQLWETEPSDATLDQAENLLAYRQTLSAEAGDLVAQGLGGPEALPLLRQVWEQHRQMELFLQQRLGHDRKAAAGRTQTREQLQGFQRFLGHSRTASMLDQRR